MPKWLSAALIIAVAVLLTAGVIFYAVGRHHFGRDVMVADIEVMSTVAEITLPAGKNTGEDILADICDQGRDTSHNNLRW